MRRRLVVDRGRFIAVLHCLIAGISGACFAAPAYEALGVWGKGGSAFFILDAGPTMMKKSLGGSSSYDLKKQAFLHSINRLPSAVKFNVAVYDGAETHVLFNELVPATETNRQKVNDWLKPLNAKNRDGTRGLETLAEGGQRDETDVWVGLFDIRNKAKERPVEGLGGWFRPAMLGMQAQAGSVFLFTSDWGPTAIELPGCYDPKWLGTRAGKKWSECYPKAMEMFEKENEQRQKKGFPPLSGRNTPYDIVKRFFPGVERPPEGGYVEYSAKDYLEGFLAIRDSVSDGKKKSKKTDISMNVILFMPKSGRKDHSTDKFLDLAKTCNGKAKLVKGDLVLRSYLKTR